MEKADDLRVNTAPVRLDKDEVFRFKKEIKCLSEVLRKKEQVLSAITGLIDGKRWLICSTQSRIICLFKLMFAEPLVLEIPLEKIVKIETKKGLIFGTISFVEATDDMGTKKTVIMNVAKKKIDRFAGTVSEAMRKKKAKKAQAEAASVESDNSLI